MYGGTIVSIIDRGAEAVRNWWMYGTTDPGSVWGLPNAAPAPGVPSGAYEPTTGQQVITQEQIIEAQRQGLEEWRQTAIPNPTPNDSNWEVVMWLALGIGGLIAYKALMGRR